MNLRKDGSKRKELKMEKDEEEGLMRIVREK